MIRSYAAFVQNTIEPMLNNVREVIELAEKKGIPLDKGSLSKVLEEAFLAHCISILLRGFINIIITLIICWTAWKILAT